MNDLDPPPFGAPAYGSTVDEPRPGFLAVIGLLVVAACVATVGLVFVDPAPSDDDLRAGDGTTTHHQVTIDGRTRTYVRFEPDGLPGSPVPLVIGLHGVSGSGEQFRIETGLDDVAELNRAVVVYPDGIDELPNPTGDPATTSTVSPAQLSTWNAGNCCGAAQGEGVDDVAFIAAVVDAEEQARPIDTTRVFVIGHSNGGMMAYRLACELSDRIAGIGVLSGTLGLDACHPAQPVSVIHIHGAADTIVPPAGQSMGGGIYGTTFRPARLAALDLAEADGCPSEPVRLDDVDDVIETWMPCDGGVEVQLTIRAGETHDYPGLGVVDEVYLFLHDHPRGRD